MDALEDAFPQATVWLDDLEEAVADAERALRARDWALLDEANQRQPRLIHGLRNSLEAERPGCSVALQRAMDQRIDQIVAVRASQIERLTVFREEVKERLLMLDRFRKAARSSAAKCQQASTFAIMR